uniref:Genome polyprotein n=1 Tax=Ornithogalum virus 3 TaxID=186643 RepID=A0A678T7R5_9POTV|nr:MAG: polyprotein [Ornithogalum virus 3]
MANCVTFGFGSNGPTTYAPNNTKGSMVFGKHPIMIEKAAEKAPATKNVDVLEDWARDYTRKRFHNEAAAVVPATQFNRAVQAARRAAVAHRRALEQQKVFEAQPTRIIHHLNIPAAAGTTAKSVESRPLQNKPIKRAPALKKARPAVTNLKRVMAGLKAVIRHADLIVEVRGVGRKPALRIKRKAGQYSALHVQTQHEVGRLRRIDVPTDDWTVEILAELAKIGPLSRKHSWPSPLKPGDSGMVLPRGSFNFGGSAIDGPTIIRGELDGELIPANKKLDWAQVTRMRHFSDLAQPFWEGFDTTFRSARKAPATHRACERVIAVRDAGSEEALLRQAIAPCFKVTCGICKQDLASTSIQVYRKEAVSRIDTILARLNDIPSGSEHIQTALSHVRVALASYIEDPTELLQARAIIGNKTEGPFKLLAQLCDGALKIGEMSTSDCKELARTVLELTRWCANRTDSIKRGDLSTFRNKASGKAHINLALMCDNQLDSNGNFLWGERSYHARRFFSNFFEEVEPGAGYVKYMLRRNPSGERRLAIGNLVVSLDLNQLRSQLTGERIEAQPITQHCVARRDGQFVYQCSCVTREDGSPQFSGVITPSKNHLVIGSTGDAKYVDLPPNPTRRLYIAKEGYCYMNIFLAMLVNVPEGEAKDFTKRVRDTLVPQLGIWPTLQQVATACYFLTIFHPDTRSAELPRILVDHAAKTLHVVDSYGTLTTGYHILKANSVNQLIDFAYDDLESSMKEYRVGGLVRGNNRAILEMLVRAIYRPSELKQLLIDEPYILLLAVLSPRILRAMAEGGAFEYAIDHWIDHNQTVAGILSQMRILAQRCCVAQTLYQQQLCIEKEAQKLFQLVQGCSHFSESKLLVLAQIDLISRRYLTDLQLTAGGFLTEDDYLLASVEKNYDAMLTDSWTGLTLLERLQYVLHARKFRRPCVDGLHREEPEHMKDKLGRLVGCSTSAITDGAQQTLGWARGRVTRLRRGFTKFCARRIIGLIWRTLPQHLRIIDTLTVLALVLTIAHRLRKIVVAHRHAKWLNQQKSEQEVWQEIDLVINKFEKRLGREASDEEVANHLSKFFPHLEATFRKQFESVELQAKRTASEAYLEKIVAMVALCTMIFGSECSDGVFKILSKLKTVFTTMHETVVFESTSIEGGDTREEDKLLTIDFETSQEVRPPIAQMDATFGAWWDHQIANGNTCPHYQNSGTFLEFSRETAESVAAKIAHTEGSQEFLVRGAVGSGKSTGLPTYLSKRGKVLVLEPTRPLAENVHTQLSREPFFMSPTLRMRNHSRFGSSPITVMTSGFALHLFANNPGQLSNYDFVIFDECHVMDASAMAFYCVLREYSFAGKILKVSATPPGRECEFKTQKPVTLRCEETLSFDSFVKAQRTGSNSDVVKDGQNILVYVASYSDVDRLSKLLMEAGFSVLKVDGRTMKRGGTSIECDGTVEKPLFIVATNIIENGVTLDIDVVVDFGMKVVADMDIDNRATVYKKVSISYGERVQRLGRVGRFKAGAALRIGHTERGAQQITQAIATEAAFYCFAYGLPVITHNVATSMLNKVTTKQARTMMQFELPMYFMADLVRYDGMMHPAIYAVLKPFKLRESETVLHIGASPRIASKNWMSGEQYSRRGFKNHMEAHVKTPFYSNGIPDTLYTKLWQAVETCKDVTHFQSLSSASACKIAYTLQTDVFAIPRTLGLIEHLIREEQTKHACFESARAQPIDSQGGTMTAIINLIRSKLSVDHSMDNIRRLEAARGQLLEFASLDYDLSKPDLIKQFGALTTVMFQSASEVASAVQLRGRWLGSLNTTNLVMVGALAVGGAVMAYQYFVRSSEESVEFQGFAKRQRQKLKFRNARDARLGREVFGEEAVEYHFGDAYTKKEKKKGKKIGMGIKNRRFVNFYGFDPTDYSIVRFVDPLTGHTLDESTTCDIQLVQDEFYEKRMEAVVKDELSKEAMNYHTTVQAYFLKHGSDVALKVDLTPHSPLKVCEGSNTIAGFPERQGQLRQTGRAMQVDVREIPVVGKSVELEGTSVYGGPRDYNPIASAICQLVNKSEGAGYQMYGVGYGPLIITSAHFFMHGNSGEMQVRSKHGLFKVPCIKSLRVQQVEGRDLVVIWMPKDFPPFPSKLKFTSPTKGSKVCMVNTIFNTGTSTSEVSESCMTFPKENTGFWMHWITTNGGHCGLPFVNTTTGAIVGLHSLSSKTTVVNYYTGIPDRFTERFLQQPTVQEWVRDWQFNLDLINWGGMNVVNAAPTGAFRPAKSVTPLPEEVVVQGREDQASWLVPHIKDNLQIVARCPNQLVTKHIVKGICPHFQLYLSTHPEAEEYFRPLMGAYGKSALNKAAFIKDFTKYSGPIEVGVVDLEAFGRAVENMITILKRLDIQECEYVNDPDAIFDSLNKNAAVGALYTGKKKDYFEGYTPQQYEDILRESCERVFHGKFGVWNGSLKAELRPMEKILANKTRVFTAAPLDSLLANKLCVDDFNNRFYAAHLKGPWTVGISKFYRGWDRLMKSLPTGWVYCDADGSRFDSSLTPLLLNAVLRVRLALMEEWHLGAQLLKNLYAEIVYTPIATPDGSVVKKFKGNNSGQASTVVDNSLMVIITMQYALERQGISLDKQDDVIRYFVNGDDLVIAVEPAHVKILTSLQTTFAELGLDFDFSNRTADRTKLSYMSHQGILRDGTYIPKICKERIVSILEWDRSDSPQQRLDAICAAQIEAWGYDDLLHEIRKFYAWLIGMEPFKQVASEGGAPYVAETALRYLYLESDAEANELERYIQSYTQRLSDTKTTEVVMFQSGTEDAGSEEEKRKRAEEKARREADRTQSSQRGEDVSASTKGTYIIPKLRRMTKMRTPKFSGKELLNLDHLISYKPDEIELSNTRATQAQFDRWCSKVMEAYQVKEDEFRILANGLMVWCIENGTSPNLNGNWIMMDGQEQVEYPLKPIVEFAKPTLRQIMAHFSDAAEAYIEMRNAEEPYMPRYGLLRNLTDMSLARYAFDFYEVHARTPVRAREAHMQMKAAALRGSTSRLFGLDGNVGDANEDTERHTADDVNRNMHSLMGLKL